MEQNFIRALQIAYGRYCLEILRQNLQDFWDALIEAFNGVVGALRRSGLMP